MIVAAVRALESERTDRLFFDPYARVLAGEEGFAIFDQANKELGEQPPAVQLRVRFIDDRVLKFVADGGRQIVIAAAGMDARAYRLNLASDIRVFEIDRAEVLDYKRQKLSTVPGGAPRATCTRIEVASDLRENWEAKLENAGFKKNERTLWVVEGLLMYLDEPSVLSLFSNISFLSAKGSIMLFDLMSKSLLNAPYMQKQLEILGGLGAPWKYGNDEPEKFMSEFGWSAAATQPGEVMPARWPFPVAPRSVPNVPRSFFVEAVKS